MNKLRTIVFLSFLCAGLTGSWCEGPDDPNKPDPTPPTLNLAIWVNAQELNLDSLNSDLPYEINVDDYIAILAVGEDLESGIIEVCANHTRQDSWENRNGSAGMTAPILYPNCNAFEILKTKRAVIDTIRVPDDPHPRAVHSSILYVVDADTKNSKGSVVNSRKYKFELTFR